MKMLLRAAAVAALLAGSGAAFAAEPSSDAKAIDGRWDAVLSRNGTEIPFRLDIKGQGPSLEGVFYDGFEPYDGTTKATFENGKLTLSVEHYLTTISATVADGKLSGTAIADNRESSSQYTFRATRHVDIQPTANVQVPSIAGNWIIPLSATTSKGEKAFNFIVQQRGLEVSASILRIDGDTGAYTGAFKDGKWVLSHFDGGRPGIIVVTPKADGTLEVLQGGEKVAVSPAQSVVAVSSKPSEASEYGADASASGRYSPTLTAYRADVAKAKGLPQPEDFLKHTTVRDPNEKFTFSFPDDSGKLVTNDDPQFKGKVVLAIVTGTWCPNCHDEAQYLVELDKKYRDKGLAIVALDFEEPGQISGLEREKAFVKKYGVKYTYLIAGSPAQMWEKVPQLNHLDTWPATVFIGRDGKVNAVHSGFASPASGDFNAQLKQDFTARIEALLAEKTPASVAATTFSPQG